MISKDNISYQQTRYIPYEYNAKKIKSYLVAHCFMKSLTKDLNSTNDVELSACLEVAI